MKQASPEQSMSWFARKENWTPQGDDARAAGDIDYARVIHSASFRRLQGKTQILNLGDSDFYRTRLTHSLEVAQISGGITSRFKKYFADHPASEFFPDRSMIHAIGCIHDLGHPPFGHGGEVALNYCMRENGGFEGNGQTLRILSRFENFSSNAGANLTRRTLLGILKYPASFSTVYNNIINPCLKSGTTAINIIDRDKSKPPKCYLDCEEDVVTWLLEPLKKDDKDLFRFVKTNTKEHHKTIHKSFDCSIMDIADDIAYGVHDLEDAIALCLISEKRFREFVPEEECDSFLTSLKTRYPLETKNDVYDKFVSSLFGDSKDRKHCISRLVYHFINAVTIEEISEFEEILLRFRASMQAGPRNFLERLKKLVIKDVITSASVQHLEMKGQMMVVSVFEAIQSDPERLLPRDALRALNSSRDDLRAICDYVAGMTDGYLLKTYDRLFSPRMGSVFDKL